MVNFRTIGQPAGELVEGALIDLLNAYATATGAEGFSVRENKALEAAVKQASGDILQGVEKMIEFSKER